MLPRRVSAKMRNVYGVGKCLANFFCPFFVFLSVMDDLLARFVQEHLHEDVGTLLLRGGGNLPAELLREAAVQIRGWQIASLKLPLWAATQGIIYPEHLALEQCSSQRTAEYKARLLAAESGGAVGSVADLTGGFGVDSTMMVRQLGCSLLFVEPREALCRLAEHNLPLLGVEGAEVLCHRAEEVIDTLPVVDWVFMDPSRRDMRGRRTVALGDCSPDVTQLLPRLLSTGCRVLLKLSPMLDISLALQSLGTGVRAVHVVSVEGECKELLVAIGNATWDGEPVVCCVNLRVHGGETCFSFTRSEERGARVGVATEVGLYLYEPDASVMKAGAFACVAARFGLLPLHRNSHLYTSDVRVENFPGRVLRVEGVCAATRAGVEGLLGKNPRGNVSVRNFPMGVEALRRQLGVREGGDAYLFGTTLWPHRRMVVVCRREGGILG